MNNCVVQLSTQSARGELRSEKAVDALIKALQTKTLLEVVPELKC